MGDMRRFNKLMDKKYALLERDTRANEKRADTAQFAAEASADTSQFAAETDRDRLPFEETRSRADMLSARANMLGVEQRPGMQQSLIDADATQKYLDRFADDRRLAMMGRQRLSEIEASKTPQRDQVERLASPMSEGGGDYLYNVTRGQRIDTSAQPQQQPQVDQRRKDLEAYDALGRSVGSAPNSVSLGGGKVDQMMNRRVGGQAPTGTAQPISLGPRNEMIARKNGRHGVGISMMDY